ncbi:MAG: SPFH domain-containing protein [Candidatus Odinarchaeota archaeon]
MKRVISEVETLGAIRNGKWDRIFDTSTGHCSSGSFHTAFHSWSRTLKLVRPNEVHVITKGNKISVYDGKGRYNLLPLIHTRQIVPKTVFEIESGSIKAHDNELLPFNVEVACKIKVVDGFKAAQSFGEFDAGRIKTFVEDTVFSAMRSTAMLSNLLDVMKNRDEIESIIYRTTEEALAKIGISVVLFDIKNFSDAAGSTVIRDLERVKSADLNRSAREAEATQDSKARVIEAQKRSQAEVARIEQEKAVAEKQRDLTARRLEVVNLESTRTAEIEREKIMIEAQAEAEKISIRAKAEADAVRMKMEAEAEGTKKIAEALQSLDQSGIAVRLAEIQKEATIEASKAVADALRENSKVFLPSGGNSGGLLESLIPGIAAMQETGYDLRALLGKKKRSES